MRPVDQVFTADMKGLGLAEWETVAINVKDPPFEARGDGVTDDTAAIRSALQVAATLGGAKVKLPAGTYRVTGQLVIGDNVILQGDGWHTSIISYDNPNHSEPAIVNAAGIRTDDFQLRDFELDCDDASNTGWGIHFTDNCSYAALMGVYVHDFGNGGVQWEGGIANVIFNCMFRLNNKNGAASPNRCNLKIIDDDGTPSTTWHIAHNYLGASDYGIYVYKARVGGGCFIGNIIEDSAVVGAHLEVTDGIWVGTYFENNTQDWELVDADPILITNRQVLNPADISWVSTAANRRIVTSLWNGYTDDTGYDKSSVMGSLQLLGLLQGDGAASFGVDGSKQGLLTLWDGSGGDKPGYIKIHSPNGTAWYLFVEDDGTLKIHNAVPTQNSDGTVVGTQT